MATRSYVIPDLDDDDNEIESPNLFSKRLKTDNSSITNENTSASSIINENTTVSSIPLNTINDTEPSSNSQFVFS